MKSASTCFPGWAAACLAVLLGAVTEVSACRRMECEAPVRPLGGIPVMVVDGATSRARAWLHVRNEGELDTPLTITLGSFVNRATGKPMSTEAVFFAEGDAAGKPLVESRIRKGDVLSTRIEVANLWEAGESSAELCINGQVHTLKAVHTDVPFNVRVESSTPEKPLLILERNRKGSLMIRNEDPKTYAVTWCLVVPNEAEVLRGEVTLLPRGVLPVAVEPPRQWFSHWFEGLFKDAERPALLTLTFTPRVDSISIPGGPVNTVPLQLRLSYWSHAVQSWWGSLILFGVLLLGGLCSLFLGLWIPNKLTRIELVKRLDELAQKTRSISRKTDSALRVGVRVERLRLWEMIRALGMLNADATEQLKQFEREIGILSRRVAWVEALDGVAQRLETLRASTSGAPPTLLRQAARSLDEATRLLKPVSPTESDFQMAQTAIRAADSRLDRIEEADPQFAQSLAAHVKTLRAEYDEQTGVIGKREKCRELRSQLKDLFEILKEPTFEDPAAITPSRYHWIDISIEKLFVLRHYILRFDDTLADPGRNERVRQCEAKLIEYLRLQSPHTLDLARRLREEIEQDIFSSDIIGQLRTRKCTVKSEPLTAYINTPVRLWVEFSDPRFRYCAALRNFRCLWEFDMAVGQEQGWEIAHYFRNEKEAEFRVHFETSDGESVSVDGSKPVELKQTIPFRSRSRERLSDRWRVETGRLLLALFIAVLALVGGAREQLLKLDVLPGLVAVFLLGFGADTVKNLFTRRG